MKINSKQYAQALYELTKDKPTDKVDIIIGKFVNNLKKNGFLRKTENIIKKFTEIYNKENKVITAKIFTSRKMEDENVKKITKIIKEKYQVREVELEMTIDKDLKGGIKIIIREEIIDNSIAGRLEKLRKELV